MIAAMLKVMVLGVCRDRGALAMAFVLPPLIFVVFAAIFSGTSGTEMRLKVAVVDEVRSDETTRLMDAIANEPSLRMHALANQSQQSLREAVAYGNADVGLIIAGALTQDGEQSPIVIVADAGRSMAGPILSGHVQRLIASQLPGVALRRLIPSVDMLSGGLTSQQRAQLISSTDEMNTADNSKSITVGESGAGLFRMEVLDGRGNVTVSYYAGAVAVMFLLFSAMQGAASLIEERSSGIMDRLAVGAAGTDVVVASKFLFLTLQGLLQVGLIFVIAWIVYDVALLPHLMPWLATTVFASAAAAGLALFMASACTSRQQANTISSFLVLVASAVGGSMVPRFMMPPWLQDIGWLTPNAWAIEAYQGALWRGENTWALLTFLWPLALVAVVSLLCAFALSRYRLRLG